MAVLAGLAAACSDDPSELSFDENGNVEVDRDRCVVVDASVSPEKIELLTAMADEFNRSDLATARVDGEEKCVAVAVQSKASGGAAQLLDNGWDEASEGPRPVIWSPASSAWKTVLNERFSSSGREPIANDATPFMLTPLVIAMPEPMAEALGWPDEPIGWNDVLGLARSQQGWAEFGHPEWGAFRLGKTNPNFSTSGLSALIAQTYAAANKRDGLSAEDLGKPEVVQFGTDVETAVVHYGDTTLTFMNNWYRADQRGNPYAYTSAAAVEEKSVIDYNTGNPDGVLQQGEQPRPPRVPLVAIYPEEGTLYSDNPLIVLDAEWVDADEKAAAARFVEFAQRPTNQERVLEFGFRPGNPDVAVTAPVDRANGVDPTQPQTLLEVPSPEVTVAVLDAWADQRKGARVTLVVDVSGSMGEPASGESADTKLDLAKSAAVSALDQFKDDDEVGLRIFTNDIAPGGATFVDVVPISRVGDVRERLAGEIRSLVPLNGTPLYDVTQRTYEELVASYDPARINAMVVLIDGRNDDGVSSDDRQQLDTLLAALAAGSEGAASRPVRVFPIAYGGDADLTILRSIAEASSGAVYDASDPRSIDKVFTAVISNF
ncbi:MAG: extracellular solute-binding protein [Acidimicrobiia bacterium]